MESGPLIWILIWSRKVLSRLCNTYDLMLPNWEGSSHAIIKFDSPPWSEGSMALESPSVEPRLRLRQADAALTAALGSQPWGQDG